MSMAQSMTASPRYAAIDAARGLALVAMFVFHIIWDLAYFGLVAETLPQESAFRWFGHSIAAAFVGLSGLGLALAARNGLDMAQALRRIGLVAAAAALVSAASYAIFPEAFIFFGILHLIALASLCALALLGAPAWIVGALAAMALAAPLLISAPLFDAPIWWWLGLGDPSCPGLESCSWGFSPAGRFLRRDCPALCRNGNRRMRLPALWSLADAIL
jgi:uncharacterized membrane protein